MFNKEELAQRFPYLTAEEIEFYCDYDPRELEILTPEEIEQGTLKLLEQANDYRQRDKEGKLDAIDEQALERQEFRASVIAFFYKHHPSNNYQRLLQSEALRIEKERNQAKEERA